MTKHCISALKSNKTIHDEAELSLLTEETYNNLPGNYGIKAKPDYLSDAANVYFFLTEHLPEQTLVELKRLLVKL